MMETCDPLSEPQVGVESLHAQVLYMPTGGAERSLMSPLAFPPSYSKLAPSIVLAPAPEDIATSTRPFFETTLLVTPAKSLELFLSMTSAREHATPSSEPTKAKCNSPGIAGHRHLN